MESFFFRFLSTYLCLFSPFFYYYLLFREFWVAPSVYISLPWLRIVASLFNTRRQLIHSSPAHTQKKSIRFPPSSSPSPYRARVLFRECVRSHCCGVYTCIYIYIYISCVTYTEQTCALCINVYLDNIPVQQLTTTCFQISCLIACTLSCT